MAEGGHAEAGRHAAQQNLAVGDQVAIAARRAIPFEEGEFRMVPARSLVVAPDPGEGEDSPLPRRQQLLAGEFRRGVEIAAMAAAVGRAQFGGEGLEMRLQPGADLERRGLDLGEAELPEQAAQRRGHPVARQQIGPAPGMRRGVPPGLGHRRSRI